MAASSKKIKFDAGLARFSSEYAHHFIPVAKKIADLFNFEKGSRRVVCTLNGTETFPCALLPHDGAFFVMVNKAIRTRLGIEAGDTVSVEIAKDESKYGMPMPEEFQEVLNQDAEGDRLFHALKPGKQRSMLYFIGKFRDVDRRIHTSLIFLEHLKRNDGKLDHTTLSEELKRPIFDL
jgi:bifunctional DNA-binding transcriptional regulator/antitoxin component of YhaV-PrlF toxin-antitoxin module